MEVTGKDFREKVIKTKKPVLIDFWGSWCIPCKQMEPIIEKLKEKIQDLAVYQVNVNRNPQLANKYQIMGVPCFLLFKDGEAVGRVIGAQTAEQLEAFIKKSLT